MSESPTRSKARSFYIILLLRRQANKELGDLKLELPGHTRGSVATSVI